jgi:hypothetical protein
MDANEHDDYSTFYLFSSLFLIVGEKYMFKDTTHIDIQFHWLNYDNKLFFFTTNGEQG